MRRSRAPPGSLLAFLAIAPFRLIRDFFRWRRTARRLGKRRVRFAAVAVWIMPLVLAAVFLVLFGEANPVIEYWLSLIDLLALLDMIQVARIIFWVVVLVMVWAFLRPRLPHFLRRKPRLPASPLAGQPTPRPAQDSAAKNLEDVLFGKAAILRSLIVFNLMFAVQTVLDAAYLWGGVGIARRHDLRLLCASRRLSADRHRADRRRLRAGGAEAGQRHLRPMR